MDILVSAGVILVLIALGAFVIHLINVQHAEHVAAYHYDGYNPSEPHDGTTVGGREREREPGLESVPGPEDGGQDRLGPQRADAPDYASAGRGGAPAGK